MIDGRWFPGLAVVALALPACRCDAGLAASQSAVTVAPASLDFGDVYLQAAPQRAISVDNAGDAPDTVAVTLVGAGTAFSVATAALSVGSGAALQLPVTYAPTQPGPASATLHLAWSSGQADVALTGQALAWPDCAPAGPCLRAAFDPSTGSCDQSPIADGAACEGGDVCLTATACVSGQCLGQPLACDDGNACTLDYCLPGSGCQSQPRKCTGTDPCQVYGCDLVVGCTSTPVPDGTPCGSQESCQVATACVGGACVGLPAPDGTPCALWWAPCVEDAACNGGSCDSATADAWTPGQKLWEWSDAGFMVGRNYQATALAVDGAGTTYLPYELDDADFTLMWTAIDSCGRPRWNIPWGQLGNVNYEGVEPMLDGDQLIAWTGQQVASLSTADGGVLWQSDLSQVAAEATGLSDAGYLQSLSASITDQGLLLFSGNFDFQSYDLLVALTSAGQPAWTQQLPFDSTGIVSDSTGNVYFSGTLEVPVVGYPDAGPWLGSIDQNGNLRFAITSNAGAPEAIGINDVVTLQGATSPYFYSSTITSFGTDGVALGGGVSLPISVMGMALGEVIDASGAVYATGSAYPPDGGAPLGSLASIATTGAIGWTTTLPDGQQPISLPALGDGNTLFLVTLSPAAEDWLLGFDTTTGAVLWQADIGPDPNYGLVEFQSAVLALTSTGLLLVSNAKGVSAFFAGQHRPPLGAPWPRQGGDNTNRYSPQSVASP